MNCNWIEYIVINVVIVIFGSDSTETGCVRVENNRFVCVFRIDVSEMWSLAHAQWESTDWDKHQLRRIQTKTHGTAQTKTQPKQSAANKFELDTTKHNDLLIFAQLVNDVENHVDISTHTNNRMDAHGIQPFASLTISFVVSGFGFGFCSFLLHSIRLLHKSVAARSSAKQPLCHLRNVVSDSCACMARTKHQFDVVHHWSS